MDFFNGPSRLSSASVSWFGVVVSVISEEPIIRKSDAPTYGMP